MSISNQTIASETWQLIEGANTALSQSQNTQKKGQAQIASGNRIAGNEVEVLDSILSFIESGKQAPAHAANQLGSPSKPQLPYPGYNSSIFDGTGEQETGLISIIGAVLALQAKSNSNFWQTLWKQAGDSMQIQVAFAPIVGSAIKNQYLAQSNATSAQASQSKWDAVISLGMFVLTMGTAGAMEGADPLEDAGPKEDPVEYEKTANTTANDTVLEDDAANVTNNSEQNQSRIEREWGNFKAKSTPVMRKAASWLGRGLQVAQLTGMISQFGTGLNGSKWLQIQSEQQKEEGLHAAASQEGQMYSQFYSQDFSRMEELRQGSSQNIDNAMNILQQAANTITQTTTSMFRG